MWGMVGMWPWALGGAWLGEGGRGGRAMRGEKKLVSKKVDPRVCF